MMIAIWIVKGIQLQKPSPKYLMRSRVGVPKEKPTMKTTSSATSAKTKASGYHRSDQSASAMPSRASRPAETSALMGFSVVSVLGTIGLLLPRSSDQTGEQ